jgi:hypothetical protein
MHPHAQTITPQFVLYNETRTLASHAWDERSVEEWEVNIPDRVIRLEILGDFTQNIEVYQIVLDVWISEGP